MSPSPFIHADSNSIPNPTFLRFELFSFSTFLAYMSYMLDAMLCQFIFKADSATSPVKNPICNLLPNDLFINNLRLHKRNSWRNLLVTVCKFDFSMHGPLTYAKMETVCRM